MRRRIGVLGLVGVGISYFVLVMTIFTGTCFDDYGFSPIVPFFVFWLVICAIIAIVCLAQDVLQFIGKNLGLGQKEEHYVTLCRHCGAKIELEENFCTHCGNRID